MTDWTLHSLMPWLLSRFRHNEAFSNAFLIKVSHKHNMTRCHHGETSRLSLLLRSFALGRSDSGAGLDS
ncbi:hypothetical protein V1277_005632 [Bradyrhizobium sp. AZCC 1588]